MLGSTGARMMRIGLPHVDAERVVERLRHSADGFAGLRSRVEEAAAAGRGPGEVAAPHAVFVQPPAAAVA